MNHVCEGRASLSLPPPQRSPGDQDVSALASRQATKEGGSEGGTELEGFRSPRTEHAHP